MFLEVTKLTKRFGGFTAVSDVSFEVAEGEILGLIGPNGSGKSTTFNLIAGALKPDAGSVRFRGAEIGGLPAYRVAHAGIGRTYQIPRPFRKLSLLENVALAAFYGSNSRISRQKAFQLASDCLRLVNLGEDKVEGLVEADESEHHDLASPRARLRSTTSGGGPSPSGQTTSS